MKPIRIRRIKRDRENTAPQPFPQYATVQSAGMDLRLEWYCPMTIWPDSFELLPTGIAIDMTAHPGLCALIFARSGMAVNQSIDLANGVGLIDNDYQGEIKVALRNNGFESVDIAPGTRIAQLVFFSPVLGVQWEEVEEFETTDRGEGGFGSTGMD